MTCISSILLSSYESDFSSDFGSVLAFRIRFCLGRACSKVVVLIANIDDIIVGIDYDFSSLFAFLLLELLGLLLSLLDILLHFALDSLLELWLQFWLDSS